MYIQGEAITSGGTFRNMHVGGGSVSYDSHTPHDANQPTTFDGLHLDGMVGQTVTDAALGLTIGLARQESTAIRTTGVHIKQGEGTIVMVSGAESGPMPVVPADMASMMQTGMGAFAQSYAGQRLRGLSVFDAAGSAYDAAELQVSEATRRQQRGTRPATAYLAAICFGEGTDRAYVQSRSAQGPAVAATTRGGVTILGSQHGRLDPAYSRTLLLGRSVQAGLARAVERQHGTQGAILEATRMDSPRDVALGLLRVALTCGMAGRSHYNMPTDQVVAVIDKRR